MMTNQHDIRNLLEPKVHVWKRSIINQFLPRLKTLIQLTNDTIDDIKKYIRSHHDSAATHFVTSVFKVYCN